VVAQKDDTMFLWVLMEPRIEAGNAAPCTAKVYLSEEQRRRHAALLPREPLTDTSKKPAMRTAIGPALVTLCILIPASLAARGGQEQPGHSQPTFRASVDVVSIQASVRDARGRPVRGLTANDFEVRDNGQLRPMLTLRADVRAPVSLAILVDMSGSMHLGSKVAMVGQALDALLAQLRVGDDEVGLFTFDSALREREVFTRNLTVVRGALSEFEPYGTTSLYDATAETARRVAARSASRKAVVVFTDGVDTSSALTAAEVSGIAGSIDVPVYVVATVSSMDQREGMDDPNRHSDAADLRDLADWTGGRFLFASTLTESVVAAYSILDEIRQQYVLAIAATDAREWRRLDVRVKRPSAVVKARSGYFGG
jgi:Ca-activated chloride channel homolog